MKGSRGIIFLSISVILCLALIPSVPQVTAFEYDLPWDLEAGILFPAIYTTGTNESGTFELWEEDVFLRVENEPEYTNDVATWDEIPDVNISMIDSYGYVTEPKWFEYLIQDAGLTWTGHDWFKPAISYQGVYETTWNAVYGDLIQTWVGPWGLDINVSIVPDPCYEAVSMWDQTFFALQYNFTFDGVYYEVMVSYWIYPSPSPAPYNSGLLQNVTITGQDATSGEMMNFFQIICDPSAPVVPYHWFIIYPEAGGSQPVDNLNYTVGDTGYFIRWRIEEDYPVEYFVYDNDTLLSSGPMNMTHYGADDRLEYCLDGLSVGVHNISIVVTNTVGRTGGDWALVNVTSSIWFPDITSSPVILIGGVGVTILVIVVVIYLRRK